MRRALIVLTLACFACGPEPTDTTDSDSAAVDAAHTFDVIVVGAGPGGIAAAIQAARMGRKTALFEATHHVGGQLLSVPSMDEAGTFYREGGIYKEFVDAVKTSYLMANHKINTCGFGADKICYEPSVGETILREMLGTPNLTLYTATQVTSVTVNRGTNTATVTGVITTGNIAWASTVLIDATEYGDLMPLAQVPYRVGNSRYDPPSGLVPNPSACVQDITYPIAMGKFAVIPQAYDLRSIGPPGGRSQYLNTVYPTFKTIENPIPDGNGGTFPATLGHHNAYRGTPDSAGPDYDGTQFYWEIISKTMINMKNDYPATVIAAEDPAVGRVNLHCNAMKRTIQFMYYVQRDAYFVGQTGWPWAFVNEIQPEQGPAHCPTTIIGAGTWDAYQDFFPETPYVREGRRLIGLHTLTGKELLPTTPPTRLDFASSATAQFTTSLGIGSYPTDLHGCNTGSTLESDLMEVATDYDPYTWRPFQIPLASSIPRDMNGFLVAEKNLSVSRIAEGSTRLQPIAMVTGQAIGALAALAVQRGHAPRTVPPLLVQRAQIDAGNAISAYSFKDVVHVGPNADPHWADIQLVSTLPIMRGYGNFVFGSTYALTRAQVAVVLQKTFRYYFANPPDWSPLANYADVDHASATYPYIEALAHAGITAGCGTDTMGRPIFCPNNSVTHAQMAIFEINALHESHANCTVKPFDDVPVGSFGCGHIARLKALGLAVGCGGKNFCPSSTLTRGEAASFLSAALLYMAKNPTTVGACWRQPKEQNYCTGL